MSFEIVRSHLEKLGLENRVQKFEVSSAMVELAAQAVDYEPTRIAKTLPFLIDGRAVLIVAAGDIEMDNLHHKNKSHTKTKMLTPDEMTELVGHNMGGVCPFGVREGVRVFLDESLKRFETVYPACGSASSAVRLAIAGLEQCSGFEGWVGVYRA